MTDEHSASIASISPRQLATPNYWGAVAVLVLMLAAAGLLGSMLLGNSAAQPVRPPYLKGAALASGVIDPHAQASSSNRVNPDIVITDIVPMTMPNSYLGVGDAIAVSRSGDPNMQVQNFWLSMHSPGTPKATGDPFTVKWDTLTDGGCGCWPVGGPFQPDHDNQGYDYALYVPNGTNGYLQIYDAAYQPKPGYNYAQGNGHMNTHFDHNTPCGDPSIQYPMACPAGQPDYNNPSTMWCALNDISTGDNEPGTNQCDAQAVNATTVYSLYYPDSTPYYFGDDVLASSWTVPADHLPQPGDIVGGVYSQTWANFADAPNPGYRITPINGNNIWRLNANVPFDGDHTINGTIGQNNYAIRLNTAYTNTQVFPMRRVSTLNNVHVGISDFYLGEVPVSQAGRTLVVSLFDPGDAAPGIANYMQLLSPPTASNPITHPVFFDAYVHDKYYPPGPPIVYLDTSQLNVTRPQNDTNDKWVDLVYQIPDASEYLGGYFQLQYVFSGQTEDRITWWMSISDNDPFTTPTSTPTVTNTATATSTPLPTNTATATDTATATYTPLPTDTATTTNTPQLTDTAIVTSTPTTTLTPGCDGWSEQAPYPLAMNGSAVVSLNGYLYSFGGLTDFTPIANAYKYDGSAWTRIADLPGLRSDARAVTDGTYIYILNGDIPGNVSNALIRYDPTSDSYTTLAAPTVATDAQAAAYLNGKIYRIGGNTSSQGNQYTNTVEVYNISANTWANVANYPTIVGMEMAVALNGYIYTAGGYDGSSDSGKKTYRYDPNTDTWDDAAIADLPTARGLAASDIFAGKWLLAGGGDLDYRNSTATMWDPAANTWSNIASMVQPRLYLNGATLGSAFYAIGGFHGEPPNDISNDNQRYTSNCLTPTTTPLATGTPISTSTPASATNTPAPATNTPLATNTPGGPTNTPAPPTVTSTNTPASATNTPAPATNTLLATNTPGGPTNTPMPPTSTTTPLPATSTPAPPTNTPMATGTLIPSATPTDCANPFVDVDGDIFYGAIHYLNCRGVINGTDATHYSPAGRATRGQFAKIVVLGFGLPFYTPSGPPDFSDVPPAYFAYLYIESGFHAGILSGFDAGSCTAHGAAYPCYLPNVAITRGQLTKLAVNAAHYQLYTPTNSQDFSDVSPSNVFYTSIETAYHVEVIAGYPDHTFRPNNNIRRDEMAQIVFKGVTTP